MKFFQSTKQNDLIQQTIWYNNWFHLGPQIFGTISYRHHHSCCLTESFSSLFLLFFSPFALACKDLYVNPRHLSQWQATQLPTKSGKFCKWRNNGQILCNQLCQKQPAWWVRVHQENQSGSRAAHKVSKPITNVCRGTHIKFKKILKPTRFFQPSNAPQILMCRRLTRLSHWPYLPRPSPPHTFICESYKVRREKL